MSIERVVNPFRVANAMRAQYLDYMVEALPIHHTQGRLRAQFREQVSIEDAFVREPIISAIPSYRTAETPRQLFDRKDAPRLSGRMTRLNQRIFHADRPLYVHQVAAIKAVQSGRNVVVATGTGSGKTECFLLPLLDEAIRSGEPSGVRAILVYPMNALANDQLDRMQSLIADSGVTFGRYTSQTPDEVEARHRPPVCSSERRSREEIRKEPPQLLLTNFAMLEYLLLRPDDQSIFRHGQVRYIVLDEAHSYTGAQGIDISLLMRKLKRRFGESLRFILTSATLGDDVPETSQQIAEFASRLTGSPFEAADVIRGVRQDLFGEGDCAELPAEVNTRAEAAASDAAIATALTHVSKMRDMLDQCGLDVQDGDGPRQQLFRTLKRLRVVKRASELVITRPRSVSELLALLAAEGLPVSRSCLERLLVLTTNARSKEVDGIPLLSARVHQFFRGVAGASVYLASPEGAANVPDGVVEQLVLEERRTADERGRYAVPLSVCHSCGFPFVIVREDGEKWAYPTMNDGEERLALTWVSPTLMAELDDEDQKEAPEDNSDGLQSLWLDMAGRGLLRARPTSPSETVVQMYVVPGANQQGDIQKCPCCGAGRGAFPSAARSFITGDDAPTAVLAEDLLRQMPMQDKAKPAGGRRLLAFSDSRQRAAFFAPYLSRTVAEASFVEPVLAAIAQADAQGVARSIPELAESAARHAKSRRWVILRFTGEDGYDCYDVAEAATLRGADERKLTRECALVLYQHMTSTPLQRTRLPRLMFAAPRMELRQADVEALRAGVPSLFRDSQVGIDAVQRMSAFLMRRFAITFVPSDIQARDLLPGRKGPLEVAVHRDPSGMSRDGMRIMRWNPYRSPSRHKRTSVNRSHLRDVLEKALRQYGPVSETLLDETFEALWQVLTAESLQILNPLGTGLFQVAAGAILASGKGPWYRCQICDARTVHPMGGQCEVFECKGQLVEVGPDKDWAPSQHLTRRYKAEPLPLRVREHTAQLSLEHGREYQDEFKAGSSNVLSCSTTFEMGVDIGDLDSVLLRNVPPSTANYLQRAGRAGRRNQSLAHAVTFARSVPHDLHHFFRPLDMVAGRVPVPIVHTQNRVLTQRHINSLLLGKFLLWLSDSGEMRRFEKQPRSLGQFRSGDNGDHLGFFPKAMDDAVRPADLFTPWSQQHIEALTAEVAAFIPEIPGLSAAGAIAAAASSLFSREEASVTQTAWYKGLRAHLSAYELQLKELREEADKAWAEGDRRKAGALAAASERVERLAADACDRGLIELLAGEHWLPNYAFPQDVVRLTVRAGDFSSKMRLERARDQGISEYAPGAEVIADGLSLTSVGIDLERREPRLETVRFLPGHRIAIALAQEGQPSPGPQAFHFIQPLGFTTSAADKPSPPNLFRRRPPPSTEVFLAEGAPEGAFVPCGGLVGVRSALGSESRLFRANLGKQKRGFHVCLRCGVQRATGGRGPHDSPWGGKCTGMFRPLALAHDFSTSVLQIQFIGCGAPDISDVVFWHTLAAALSNAACDLLEISRNDLVCGYRASSETGQEGELYLYDKIPGGAGYAERIQERLADVLTGARRQLETCENAQCDAKGSCYGCLRNYSNQFHWEHLQRAVPLAWLAKVTATQSLFG